MVQLKISKILEAIITLKNKKSSNTVWIWKSAATQCVAAPDRGERRLLLGFGDETPNPDLLLLGLDDDLPDVFRELLDLLLGQLPAEGEVNGGLLLPTVVSFLLGFHAEEGVHDGEERHRILLMHLLVVPSS